MSRPAGLFHLTTISANPRPKVLVCFDFAVFITIIFKSALQPTRNLVKFNSGGHVRNRTRVELGTLRCLTQLRPASDARLGGTRFWFGRVDMLGFAA